ncbi:transposase [Candidatus Micrarchaeota archaeon]|nr:transposase [Candidatus Micrarchaeota archaeon]
MVFLPENLKPFSSQEKEKNILEKLSRELLNYNLFQFRANARYNSAQIMKLFVDAAISNKSTENRSKTGNYPSADDALLHIKDKTTIENIERMMRTFVSRRTIKLIQRRFPSIKVVIAFDFTPEAFYGDKNCEYVTGYEPKDGTYYCFKFFTVALVVNGIRFLLFAYPVYRGDDKIALINKALEFLNAYWIKPDLVLLDREFYETDVFALFREKRINFLMPAKQDSHFERVLKECKGLPAVFQAYEISNSDKESEWIDLVIIEDNEHEEKKIYGYVTNIPVSEYRNEVLLLSDLYKQRWGIETAHRVHDQFRIKTSCKEGNVRYFFFVISMLLYNFWVYINLLMNDFNIENFEIKITVDEIKDELIDFFRNNLVVLPLKIAM